MRMLFSVTFKVLSDLVACSFRLQFFFHSMLLHYFICQHGFLGVSHGSWRLEEGIGVLFFHYLLLFADLVRSVPLPWLGKHLKIGAEQERSSYIESSSDAVRK